MSVKLGWLGAGTGVASTQETGPELLLLKISDGSVAPFLPFRSLNLSGPMCSPRVSEAQG